MLTWLTQNIGTIVILAVLAVIFGLMLYSLIRDKKAGKSSCGGGCAGCANACYCHSRAASKDPSSKKTESVSDADTLKGGN